MRILFACLLLSTASLAKLVDDPQCELNKGKLCPGGCCYDNQQVTRIYFAYLEAEIPTQDKAKRTQLGNMLGFQLPLSLQIGF